MTAMQRLRLGDLDLSHRDVFERDIEYIYDEIFPGAAYDHPSIKLPERPTIIDVGANVGIYSIWAARKYRPKRFWPMRPARRRSNAWSTTLRATSAPR